MDLIRLQISNFLIISNADISLSGQGLVRVAGDNNDDTTSSSNGSGKSSVVEAIYWCLFGDTLRGLRYADAVVNNAKGKDCYVKLDLENEGTKYRIERYRKHNKHVNKLFLYINNEDSRDKNNTDTQELIERLLGIDKVSFANSIVFGQGNTGKLKRFSEMTDSEKKACMEKVLDLEVYGNALEVVKRDIASIELQKSRLDHELSLLVGSYNNLDAQKSQASLNADSFEVTRKERIFIVDTAIGKAGIDKQEVEENIVNLGDPPDIVAVQEGMGLLQEMADICSDRLSSFKDKVSAKRLELMTIKNSVLRDVSELRKRVEALVSNPEGKEECWYCTNPIIPEKVESRKEGFEFDIADKNKTIKDLDGKLNSLGALWEVKKQAIESKIAVYREQILNCQKDLAVSVEYSAKVAQLKSEKSTIESKISSLLEKRLSIEEEENTWLQIVSDCLDRMADLKSKLQVLRDKQKSVVSDLPYLEFWREGFSRSGIRSFLLDRVTPFLNDRLSYYLGLLTDGGITAKFSTKTQLASGEWREKFNLEVYNKQAAAVYEGNSSGERRRIDMSVMLALNDFLSSRSGSKFNILFLDEIFENIDSEGLYYVVKVLESLAATRSSVFCITHREELQSYFTNELRVVRNNGVSVIQ